MLDRLRAAGFDVATRNHAAAILSVDFPDETAELVETLLGFRIATEELVRGGGGESGQTRRLRRALSDLGWRKHNFVVRTIVDGAEREAVSHEIDHVRRGPGGTLALEIEWNNKDPFFDRDLENFQRLHALSAVSVGVIVTRGASLQAALLPRIRGWMESAGLGSDADLDRLGIGARTVAQAAAVRRLVAQGVPYAEGFARRFVSDKFGVATTHWAKLESRVQRGVGNPCPLLLVGLPDGILADAPVPPEPVPPGLFGET